MYLWMTSSISPLFASVTFTSASFKTPLNHFQQPKKFTTYNLVIGRYNVLERLLRWGKNKKVGVYVGLKNFSFGAPQIGHLSGASPSTVFPQTPHT